MNRTNAFTGVNGRCSMSIRSPNCRLPNIANDTKEQHSSDNIYQRISPGAAPKWSLKHFEK